MQELERLPRQGAGSKSECAIPEAEPQIPEVERSMPKVETANFGLYQPIYNATCSPVCVGSPLAQVMRIDNYSLQNSYGVNKRPQERWLPAFQSLIFVAKLNWFGYKSPSLF
jgi:hypothetical protein